MSMPPFRNLLMPPGTLPDARLLLAARALRAFGDGYVSLLLPYYLTLLGYSALEIGLLVTATLLGSVSDDAGYRLHRASSFDAVSAAGGQRIDGPHRIRRSSLYGLLALA